jgi:hypothetical protein
MHNNTSACWGGKSNKAPRKHPSFKTYCAFLPRKMLQNTRSASGFFGGNGKYAIDNKHGFIAYR